MQASQNTPILLQKTVLHGGGKVYFKVIHFVSHND